MSSGSHLDYEHLLRDNYETPLFTPKIGMDEAELHRTANILKLSVSDFMSNARNLESPDELSAFMARQLMTQVAPSLLWITLHDIDIAHSGPSRCTSTAFGVRTVSVPRSGVPSRPIQSTKAAPPHGFWLSDPESDKTRSWTDRSIHSVCFRRSIR